MIATRAPVCRFAATSTARTSHSSYAASAASRPLTVAVRAFQGDAVAKKDSCCCNSTAAKDTQQQQVAKQQPAQVAPRPSSEPGLVRLPSVFHEMQREMDAMSRMFGLPSFFPSDMLSSGLPAQLQLPALPSMRLAVDVEEDDKTYIIKADTPGIPKESLKLSVLDGTLTISGERCNEKQEGGGDSEAGSKSPLRYERSYGSFSRSFSLPPNVDVEGIKAVAQDGVLTITLPKVPEEQPQPKEIDVE